MVLKLWVLAEKFFGKFLIIYIDEKGAVWTGWSHLLLPHPVRHLQDPEF